MARVNPFGGVRYNPKAISNIGDVLAPPYDVISSSQQQELYDRHDRNIVRLILGYQREGDSEDDNRYTRSAEFLKIWMADATLSRDDKPAFYLYAQDYEVDGKKMRRVGFMCRRLIEPLGTSIFPHERTLSGPKTDRLNLTRACKMNFSPIFGLYSDPSKKLDKIWESIMNVDIPDIDVTDEDGVRHLMWTITDGEIILTAQGFLENIPVVIADGHHRYETAINYRNERRAQENPSGRADYDYALMYLSNSCGEGFTVLPTHRIVKDVPAIDMAALLASLGEYFEVKEEALNDKSIGALPAKLAAAGKNGPAFGMIAPGGKLYLLKLNVEKYAKNAPAGGVAAILHTLDVAVLQELVFEKILGVSKEQVADKKVVGYTINAAEAAQQVSGGGAKLAFILNPADVNMVIKVATAGGVMPQKSTYFYPKLISGLVMNPLW